MRIDTGPGRSHAFWGQFELLIWGQFFWVSSGSRFALSESIFDLTQGPPLCVRSSFNHDGF